MRRQQANSPKIELRWDGRALSLPRELDGGLPGGDGRLWMCAQDVGTEMWTQFNQISDLHRDLPNRPVRLDGCSDFLRDVLIECLPYNSHREDLAGALGNFVQMVGQQLVLNGEVTFEVQCGWDTTGDAPVLTEARLAYIYPSSLIRFASLMYQVVPASVDRDSAPRILRLDKQRIVTFRPPKTYRRALRTIRRVFPVLGRSEDRWMTALANGLIAADFKAERREFETLRARVSAPIGWNARGLYRDYITDFHWSLRELRWRRFCIDTRDAVLDLLSEVFRLLGELRGEHPVLVCGGLPSHADVDVAEQRLVSVGCRIDELFGDYRRARASTEA